MAYTIDRTFDDADFPEVVEKTRAALAKQGFGVLTEIDVKATLKKKLDVDIDPYLILGACNPTMAHQAMMLEPRIGAMLPCNVIVRSLGERRVEVSAIDPVTSMEAVENAKLTSVAAKVRQKLETVVADI
jgi:uncharacterized protein (DUF302 family)